MVFEKGFSLVINSITQHPIREDITRLITTLSQDILRGQIVQRRVRVDRFLGVPLTEHKRTLKQQMRRVYVHVCKGLHV